MSLERLIVST